MKNTCSNHLEYYHYHQIIKQANAKYKNIIYGDPGQEGGQKIDEVLGKPNECFKLWY